MARADAAGHIEAGTGGWVERLKAHRHARLIGVLLGHMTVDTFNGMNSVLMAFLSVHILPMTNTQIGAAISAYSLTAAISQPFFGLWADRSGGRLLGAGGVAWTVSFLMLAVIFASTGQYWLMLIPFVLAALGSGAFHPVGTMHAGGLGKVSSASRLSWFFLAGQTGLAIGPTLTGVLLDSAATHNGAFTTGIPAFSHVLVEHGTVTPLLGIALFAIPGVLLMALTLPSRAAYHAAHKVDSQTSSNAALPVMALALLAFTVTLRSLSNPGAVAFIPRLFQEKGWSAAEYGLVTSAYWIASGVTGIIFGWLADRLSSRVVTGWSLIAAAPAIFLLPLTDGATAFTMALLAGGLTGGSHSLLVAMSQRLMPKSRGFASGATLGFIFGTGAIGTLVIGALSDQMGLTMAFQVVAVVTVASGVMSFALRDRKG